MIGSSRKVMSTAQFALDTGTGMNLIRRDTLPAVWEDGFDRKAIYTRLNDVNGRPLSLRESTWLAVRFSNYMYHIKFIVANRISVEVIIGTAFLNLHVLDIL